MGDDEPMSRANSQLLRVNCFKLVDKMEPDDVVTMLKTAKVLTGSDVDKINESNNRRKKVTTLLDILDCKSNRAVRELVNALVVTEQDHLARLINPNAGNSGQTSATSGPSPSTALEPATTASDFGRNSASLSTPQVPLNVKDGPMKIANLEVIKTSEAFYRQHSKQAYPMHKLYRGLVVIINVQTVVGMGDRVGTDVDRDHLKQVFEQLHFRVKIFDNPSSRDIRNKLRGVQEDREALKDSQCFVLCVLSHGDITKTGTMSEEVIYGSEGRAVPTSEIFEYFDNSHCPELAGKPRVVIFQACRVEAEPANAPDRGSLTDFIICYPTESGCFAWRNRHGGGWYINYLVQEFIRNACQEDICAMLNAVNGTLKQALAAELPEAIQASSFTSYLTKRHLYFFPGYTSDQA